MKELAFQSLIAKAAREVGGFAHKMSSRFLVGVPDLLLQLPSKYTGMWEVKIDDMPKMKSEITPAVTPLQLKWLREYINSDGVGGVISGVRSDKGLYIKVYRMVGDEETMPPLAVDDYVLLPRGRREEVIVSEICKYTPNQS